MFRVRRKGHEKTSLFTPQHENDAGRAAKPVNRQNAGGFTKGDGGGARKTGAHTYVRRLETLAVRFIWVKTISSSMYG